MVGAVVGAAVGAKVATGVAVATSVGFAVAVGAGVPLVINSHGPHCSVPGTLFCVHHLAL